MIGHQRRPDADELLAQVNEQARRARRGKLTVFFGAAPGVGKTFAMLEAAHREREGGVDVVVGIVETHGRAATAELQVGLETVPRRRLDHRGVKLDELDVDAVVRRHPTLVLVDELAHTNAPGSRHSKRWQDVDELLDAGIDVFTTVNVQHLESLNDVVAQISGVQVKETIPDRVLEGADELRLVDLPPDELLERLASGKIYVPEQAARALDGFFKKGTLTALRELALRRTAERVDDDVLSERRAEGVVRAWPVRARVLVCVSASPAAPRLVRGARRVAASLRAEWIAAYVETAANLRMSDADRERVAATLRLAEQLGAETARLSGESAAEEIVSFARQRNVSTIVVGKPTHSRWRDLLHRSFLDEIVRATPDIDIQVVTSEPGDPPRREAARVRVPTSWPGLAAAVVVDVLATAFSWFVFGHDSLADVVMVYLFGIVLVSLRFGYGPSIVATVLGVLSLDLFFVPPYFSFSVSDLRHVVTFAVMFAVAVVISRLNARIRAQGDAARSRERRTARLYAMSRELAESGTDDAVAAIAERHVGEAFDARTSLILPDATGALGVGAARGFAIDAKDAGVVDWVWGHGKSAGLGTDTVPSSSAQFLVLRGSRGKVGVLGLRPSDPSSLIDPEQRQLLDTFAAQVAAALERLRLADEARRIEIEVETERLRSSLLSSVSHDLRTPLGVITGATSTLLEDDGALAPAARRDLLETAHEEAERLNRLVRNLLDMTRLSSGALKPRKEWHPLDEIVGVALGRLADRLGERKVELALSPELPPIAIDDVLIEQVFINLLENALKYTPEASPIRIAAEANATDVTIEIADRGPGIPEAERHHVFEKFYRLSREGAAGGAGLGLAICRAVIDAHGGKIWVDAREGGGASFKFSIPKGDAPRVGG